MKKMKQIFALILMLALVGPAVFSAQAVEAPQPEAAAPVAAQAQPAEAPAPSAPPAVTYNDTFEDDFESGTFDKWEHAYFKTGYTDNFAIVDDPAGTVNPETGEVNKVLSFSKTMAYLVVKREYWPAEGIYAGQMQELSFRIRYREDTFDSQGIMLSFLDAENHQYIRHWANYPHYVNQGMPHFMRSEGYVDGTPFQDKSGSTAGALDLLDWVQVRAVFTDSNITISFTDVKGKALLFVANNKHPTGRFAIGSLNLFGYNQERTDAYYIDDVQVSFKKLSVDGDDTQKNVNVYFSGNTFQKPGDALNITGEQLGNTVESVTVLKLSDMLSATAADAHYVAEQTYEYAKTGNITWAQLQAAAVPGSEQALEIKQRTKHGITIILPDGSNDGDTDDMYQMPGAYALFLKSSAGGSDAIVLVNNPQISMLLHDDGEAATPNGWIKLAGSNLSVSSDAAKVKAIITDGDGTNPRFVDPSQIRVETEANNNGRANAYYMQIMIGNLPAGNYKIMVHNGYGGDYGWSEPFSFTVKAQEARMAWRSRGTFDVKDYGATGNSHTNDTAAVISAIEAASNNGGGIVYFPQGTYRITDTLYVPDGISLEGAGPGVSCIFYDTIGLYNLPEALIIYEENFEVSNLNFYGGAVTSIFKFNQDYVTEKGYQYFHDIELLFDPYIAATEGKGALLEDLTTALDAQVWIKQFINQQGGTNTIYTESENNYRHYIEMENCSLLNDRTKSASSRANVMLLSDYLSVQNSDFNTWSVLRSKTAGFVQGGEFNCIEKSGPLFFSNCYFHDSNDNNREVLYTDGSSENTAEWIVQDLTKVGLPDGKTVEEILESELAQFDRQIADAQAQGDDAKAAQLAGQRAALIADVSAYVEENRGRAFRILGRQHNYASTTRNTMYINEGQGAGQVRDIQSNTTYLNGNTYFTVENAFAVNPNRNSRCIFYFDRVHMFVVNCDFNQGIRVGPYGQMVDAVYAGNHFTNSAAGVILNVNGSVIWYLSSVDNVATDILTGHTIETRVVGAGIEGGKVTAQLSYFNILYRRNTVGETGYFAFGGNGANNGIEGFMFEDNHVDSATSSAFPVMVDAQNIDGVWLRKNTQYQQAGDSGTSISPYSDAAVQVIRNSSSNRYGSLRIYCDEYGLATVITQKYGDVNNDGKVSLKDVTVIRFYLAERLSEAEVKSTYGNDAMKFADCDANPGVDSRDIFEIYAYLLHPDTYSGRVGTNTENPGGSSSSDTSSSASSTTEIPWQDSSDVYFDYRV